MTPTGVKNFNLLKTSENDLIIHFEQLVESRVKPALFKQIKFITRESMLAYSTNDDSICFWVCDFLQITGESQRQWFWSKMKETVKKLIEKQRSNVTSAMKRAFMGKYPQLINFS